MTTQSLPTSLLAVLEAMTLPDPRPPVDLDSPADAIQRRLPHVSTVDVVDMLHTLKALGLVDIPYDTGTTTAAATANLQQWISPKGWEALGMDTDPSGPRPS